MFPRAWPGDGGGGGEGPLPGQEKPLPHVQTRLSCLLFQGGDRISAPWAAFPTTPGWWWWWWRKLAVPPNCLLQTGPRPDDGSFPPWPSWLRVMGVGVGDGIAPAWARRFLQCAERFLWRLALDGTVNHGLPKLVFIELAPLLPPVSPGSHDAGNPGRKRPGPGLVEESGS